jgi:hypothetical protein
MIRYPEEVLTDQIQRQRIQSNYKNRRKEPFPACTKICTVFKVWGEKECLNICRHKFEGKN